MTDIRHEITLDCQLNSTPVALHPWLVITCTCGEFTWTSPFPVQYADLAPVLLEHLKEQAQQDMKDVLKQFSGRDIIKILRSLRHDR